MGPEVPENEDDWNIEGFIIVRELERTVVCGKLRKVQGACRVKDWKVSRSCVEVIEKAARVGAAQK